MGEYDPTKSHAQTALNFTKKGKYKHEVCNYALDLSFLDSTQTYFRSRVLIITNETVLMIEMMRNIKAKVKLRDIKGVMHYYFSDKSSSVNLELKNGKVEALHLNDPEKNEQFINELERQLKVLEK
jgi:hypothetical protein